MVSLFGLWIEKRARLAGRGPALPQKGGATAGNARTTQREGERRVARFVPQGCSRCTISARQRRNGVTAARRRPQTHWLSPMLWVAWQGAKTARR